MTEPISKKSGTIFRKERALKNENLKIVLKKTHKIDTIFQPKKSTDVQSRQQDNSLNNFNNNSGRERNEIGNCIARHSFAWEV